MDKKDLILSIVGFIFLVLTFMLAFTLTTTCIGPLPHPCDFTKIADIINFFLFKVLIFVIPIIYIIASFDLILTKNIFKSRKLFALIFLSIIIIYCAIISLSGCTSHCTIMPTQQYVSIDIWQFETDIISTSKRIEPEYGSVRIKSFTSNIIDKICFYQDNTSNIYSKGELLKTIQMNKLELEETPFCIQPKRNEFRLMFEGLGDRTKISSVSNS